MNGNESLNFNVHLFFDVFIEDAPLGKYLRGDKKRFDLDKAIRSQNTSYRYQTKYDITRYTLYSYSQVNWKSVTLRIECENKFHNQIYDELKELFPNSSIINERSADSETYLKALNKIDSHENDWIFFSPNNDHPLISNPISFYELVSDVNNLNEKFLDDSILSIPFSHFTEGNNCKSIFSPLWGYYANIYPKKIKDFNNFSLIKMNKMLLDSVHLYKYKDIKKFFHLNENKGRLIRPEDTSLYLKKKFDHYVAVSKKEICRHYDGYSFFLDKVPPLFIPEGFFEKKVKIYFGNELPNRNYVYVNPKSKTYSYQNEFGADLKCHLEDIPFFWESRISEVINDYHDEDFDKSKLEYYKNVDNPWSRNILLNFIKSLGRLIKNITRLLIK